MNRSVWRAARAISMTMLAVSLVAPAAVSARSGTAGAPAGASPELHMSIGTRCLDGRYFVKGDSVRLTQRRGTKTLTDLKFKMTSTRFSRCLKSPVLAGDLVGFVRIVGTRVAKKRTVTVPDLRITGDLEANTLTVHGSRGGVPLTGGLGLGASAHIAGMYVQGLGTGAPLDEAGNAVVHMVWYDWTLRPGDLTYTLFATQAGDRIYRWWAPMTMNAQTGKATVTGSGRPGRTLTLTLAAAGGATRATAITKVGLSPKAGQEAHEGSPRYAATFRKNGTAVTAKVGNRITATGMDPLGQTLLVNDFQATAGEGDATVTGTCHPDSRVGIQHSGYVEWTFDSPSGNISRSDLFLTSDERVVVGCQTADGYAQRFPVTVP